MKKIIASTIYKSDSKFAHVQFNEEYEFYDLSIELINKTVCRVRSPSGKLSCATIVGYNGLFTSILTSLHGQDEKICTVDYLGLKIFKRLLPLYALIQSEVRFGANRFYAFEQQESNALIQRNKAASARLDSIELIVMCKIEGAIGLLPYDITYGFQEDQHVYVPVVRSEKVTILEARIFLENSESKLVKYGEISEGVQLNYLLIQADLHPGDSGAPVIIEKYGKVFYLGYIRSIDESAHGIVPLWGQAEEHSIFCETEKDMIRAECAESKRIVTERPLSEWYSYGQANSAPHIHCYNGGFHIQMKSRNRTKRLNIVQNNIFYEDKLKEALNEIGGIQEPLKDALLKTLNDYGFDYIEEKDDFNSLEEFKSHLKKNKINFKLL